MTENLDDFGNNSDTADALNSSDAPDKSNSPDAGQKKSIKYLNTGDKVHGQFAIKYRKPPRVYANGFMFELRVSDKTDEITVKYWGDRDKNAVTKLYESIKETDVVRVKGIVNEYSGKLEIGVSKADGDTIKVCAPSEYDISDFVGQSERNLDEMMQEVSAKIDAIKNAELKRLLNAIFGDAELAQKFKTAPASMMYHQNYIGGLLEHTLNVANICERLADLYSELDRDLLICGALLHDIGKIWEFKLSTTIDVTEEGMLLGHLIIGARFVMEKIAAMEQFPEELRLKISHLLISHHGELEHGSPKKPQMPEAAALYYADMADALIFQYVRAKKEAKTDDWHWWTKKLGQIYLK